MSRDIIKQEYSFRKMVVKVYGSVRAACPQRVMACLIEKGVEFEIVHIDLDLGEQKKSEFLGRQVKTSLLASIITYFQSSKF